jgi:hypothetical protein
MTDDITAAGKIRRLLETGEWSHAKQAYRLAEQLMTPGLRDALLTGVGVGSSQLFEAGELHIELPMRVETVLPVTFRHKERTSYGGVLRSSRGMGTVKVAIKDEVAISWALACFYNDDWHSECPLPYEGPSETEWFDDAWFSWRREEGLLTQCWELPDLIDSEDGEHAVGAEEHDAVGSVHTAWSSFDNAVFGRVYLGDAPLKIADGWTFCGVLGVIHGLDLEALPDVDREGLDEARESLMDGTIRE